ncbi:MAG: hypothetical protein R2698_08945 [Microthrixaceae bacterium]
MGVTLRVGVPVLLLAAVLMSVGASCGDDPPPRSARTTRIVIPVGTKAAVDRGEAVAIFSSVMRFKVGDRLIIRNDDEVTHVVGPYTVRAGERIDVRFRRKAIYPGPCSANDAGRTVIMVQ